jgi:predicted ATP-dependent protease
MKTSWRKWARAKLLRARTDGRIELHRRVNALYEVLGEVVGADKLVLKAGKLDALELMRSRKLSERVLGMQRIVYEDPTLDEVSSVDKLPRVLDELEEALADLMARRSVEDTLEKKVAQRMQARHEEYMRELRMQLLREEGGPDNAQTLKKYAELEKLDQLHLARSAVELLRPTHVREVVGQERAIAALFAKIASPFPQHVILYGPPGVGKTTVARLALEYAKTLPYTPFGPDARFVEVNGATLRWDPREVANPLLGSVHDPIYQGARRDLADSAIPEPKPGLVTEAHGGVLFIDEIGEMDPMLQNKLLKVLEDKRVYFESAYYDSTDPHVPKYIRKLFEEGAPADFLLIGATTRDPSEINPALRSRCAEVYFDPLTQDKVQQIVRNAAAKLGAELEAGVAELISSYTVEGRKAAGLVADAYSVALHRHLGVLQKQGEGAQGTAGASGEAARAQEMAATPENAAGAQATAGAPEEAAGAQKSATKPEETVGASAETAEKAATPAEYAAMPAGELPKGLSVTLADVQEIARISRLAPYVQARASKQAEVGKILGLAVSGYLGGVLEIEAVAFKAEPGKGTLRFNQTAGSMTKDSVFNAAAVVRRLTGENLSDWDVHINVIGGGRIDGPSAGTAIVLAIISAILEWPLRQDVAVTGEVSIQGRVKAVGGVHEKLYGAHQSGVTQVLIPQENAAEARADFPGMTITPISRVEEALPLVFAGEPRRRVEQGDVALCSTEQEALAGRVLIPPLQRAPGV